MAVVQVSGDGWLTVPWDGPELVVVEIGVGGIWRPAFLDFENGQRVAMIRHPAPPGTIVNAQVRHRPPEGRDG